MNEPQHSCLVCGNRKPFGVWHASHPEIGVCVECREAAQLYPETKRDLENAEQWIDSDPEWKAKFIGLYQRACEERNEALSHLNIVNVELHNLRTQVEKLHKVSEFHRQDAEALRHTIVSTVGGVDYEGIETNTLNFLQRLRILVANENKLKSIT